MDVIVKIFKKDEPLKELSRIVTAEPVIRDNHKISKVYCDRVGHMISEMLQEVNQDSCQSCMFTGMIIITPEMYAPGSKIKLIFQEDEPIETAGLNKPVE